MDAVSFENVSVVYGEGTPFKKTALDGVSVSMPSGGCTGIIGHTGSGKSTLAMLTNGLLKPTAGRVLINGRDIWDGSEKMSVLRSRVGLVFQYPEHQLFESSVLDDISFGPKNQGISGDELLERVLQAAEICGIDENLLRRSPFELSGGQKRRVAIAGIMAMRPEVLVLDEPAAGLDPVGRENIMRGFEEYRAATGATVLIISHSMEDIAGFCDRILVLKNGRVYMHGSISEVFLQAERLYDASLDLPQITKLFVELKKRGLTENADVYTVPYAKKCIDRLIKGN